MSKCNPEEKTRDLLLYLRRILARAGGKEILNEEEWKAGLSSIGRRRSFYTSRTSTIFNKKEENMAEGYIEPVLNIFYEDKEVIVVAEIPGVEKTDLKIEVEGNTLTLGTLPAAPRRYFKKIILEQLVSIKSMAYRNGILEIRLQEEERGSSVDGLVGPARRKP